MHRQLHAPEHRDPKPLPSTLGPIGLLLLLFLSVGGPLALADDVTWDLYDHTTSCALPPGIQIPCGDFGTFVVSFDAGGAVQQKATCLSAAGNTETPPGFGARKVLDYEGFTEVAIPTPVGLGSGWSTSNPVPLSLVGTKAFGAAGVDLLPRPAAGSFHKETDPNVPCSGGRCFAADTEVLTDSWVAAIDWEGLHGWTVGWTILTMSNHEFPVALYSFDELDPALNASEGVTDLHVLAASCQIAEDIDTRGFDPPLMVNLSLGRPVAPTDNPSGGCNYLSCMIDQVFDYIQSHDGPGPSTKIVASTGNHQEILFPGFLERVIAAGSLDLAEFNALDKTAPSWETVPVQSDERALMPGYGICLHYTHEGDRRTWPAPAGSSYAAAAFTGWAALAQSRNPIDPGKKGLWRPIWAPSIQNPAHPTVYLNFDGTNVAEYPSEARSMLARVFDRSDAPCGTDDGQATALSVTKKTVAQPVSAVLTTSILASQQESSRPTPEPDPCVPCSAGGGGGGGGFGKGATVSGVSQPGVTALGLKPISIGGGGTPTPSPTPTQTTAAYITPPPDLTGSPVILDMSAHAPLPERQTLSKLFLRFGEDLYDLQLSSRKLENFTNGIYTHIAFYGFDNLFCETDQPSLVYLIDIVGEVEPMWSSTPIHLLPGRWSTCG